MTVFFTSDTHFNQERTFKFSKRNRYFKDVDDMNNEMVKRWNEVVSDKDTVIHIGDFGDENFLYKLNGKIILQEGNYERDGKSIFSEKVKGLLSDYLTSKVVSFDSDNLITVHEPSHIPSDYRGFYLFGHIHEKQMVKRNYNGSRYGLNVGVDCHNFYPISTNDVEFYRVAIRDHYDSECYAQDFD